MTDPRPLMRALSLALHEFTQEHGGKDPWQVTMAPGTRDALYREMFGDKEGEDLRAALAMEIAIDESVPPGQLRFS